MNNISQKIIQKIKEEKITPKPRWEFLLKNYVFWSAFAAFVLVGSLAFSVIIFTTATDGWNAGSFKFGFWKLVLLNVPFFWILLLILFLFLAYYNLKYTKKGYRHNPYLVVAVSVLASVILGTGIYFSGAGQKTEEVFYRGFPFYRKIINRGGQIWLAPQEGRLAGVVVGRHPLGFVLESFSGRNWVVILKEKDKNNPLVERMARVKIIGRPVSEDKFEAEQIAPWFNRMPGFGPPPPTERK